ncbi:sugar transferase [Sphingomonas sp. LY29]|uniref:sugar transferase n=1 Tax=Sphingomonas sp. LY29 TaxID=3095341 RepID=UPI002D7A25A3|nr:sugar transferase [Sphingomonas sp. LY29]WRP25795.1 sugar transferase [Sphingomonas sp. LY29]
MLHMSPTMLKTRRSFFARQRFNLLGALVAAAVIPFVGRAFLTTDATFFASSINAFIFNVAAVIIAFWTRLSIETYPGNRSAHTILPSAILAHGVVIAVLLMARLPYDRLALLAGLILHIVWGFVLYIAVQRRIRHRIAVVPFGDVERLFAIEGVDWHRIDGPDLERVAGCDALVADFTADIPDEWQAFLADAAIEGRMVYQVKQLDESLTGRVAVDHLSENSFGSLVPTRGYVYLKSVVDFIFALLLVVPLMPFLLLVGIAVRLDSKGPALFRQRRVGRGGVPFQVIKFRTMTHDVGIGDREAAITDAGDLRVTKLGGFLRKSRIDELPQIFNILAGQMSWIGPRPEAEVLSSWYTGEIPFYRYRHVVRPGISGWAQVNQGHVASVDEVHAKLQYDFYYIKYFSAWLDILITFRTIRTMLSGFGAR